jgi:hypothetical protein
MWYAAQVFGVLLEHLVKSAIATVMLYGVTLAVAHLCGFLFYLEEFKSSVEPGQYNLSILDSKQIILVAESYENVLVAKKPRELVLNRISYDDENEEKPHSSHDFEVKSMTGRRGSLEDDDLDKKRLLSFSPPIELSISTGTSASLNELSASVSMEIDEEKKNSLKQKADLVFLELLQTERTYARKLSDAVHQYLEPMILLADTGKFGAEVEPGKIMFVFGNMEMLAKFHAGFAEQLESGGSKSIASTFLKQRDFFLMSYRLYIEQYDNRAAVLKNLKEVSKRLFKFLGHQTTQGIDELSSLLITPVQRIPRYILLLKELVSCTFDEEVREKLKETQEVLDSIVQEVNEAKKKADTVYRMIELQNAFGSDFDSLVIAGRELIREGTLLRKTSSKFQDTKKITFVLFSDIIVWASESLRFKGFFSLEGLAVSNGPMAPDTLNEANDDSVRELKSSIGRRRSIGGSTGLPSSRAVSLDAPRDKLKQFTLYIQLASRKPLILLFSSESERNSWSDSILTAIEDLRVKDLDPDAMEAGED